MGAVKNLCKRGIVLNQGQVAFDGGVEEAVESYTKNCVINQRVSQAIISRNYEQDEHSLELEYLKIEIHNDVNNMSNEEPLELELTFKRNNPNISHCQFGIAINNASGEEIGVNFSQDTKLPEIGNIFKALIKFENHQLAKGEYSMVFSLCQNDRIAGERTFDVVHNVISFEVNYLDKNHLEPFLNWPKKSSISYKPSSVSIERII